MIELMTLEELDEATLLAAAAVEDDPSRDLSVDEQETLAWAFLKLRKFVEGVHIAAVEPDVSGADFYQLVTDALDNAGLKESWEGHRYYGNEPGRVVIEGYVWPDGKLHGSPYRG